MECAIAFLFYSNLTRNFVPQSIAINCVFLSRIKHIYKFIEGDFMRRFTSILCLFAMASLPLFAQDPCSQTTQLTGGTTISLTTQTQRTGNITGTAYHFEAWKNGSTGSGTLVYYGAGKGGGAAYKVEWTNPNDFLGRIGYYWGNGGPYTQYKNIYCDFNYTRSGRSTAGNYSYIGIYGWSRNPLIEYYIVEDWFGNQWQSDATPITTNTTGGTVVGTYTMDGSVYQVVKNTRTNQPSIDGTRTFTQYFSLRQTPRKCGTISVTEHFKKWAEMEMPLGNMYEAKFLAEAGGGIGWLDLSYLSFTQEDTPRGESGIFELTKESSLRANLLPNAAMDVYFTAKGNETELRIYGLNGDRIASTVLQTVAGESRSHTFNQNLPSGSYIVWMNSNGHIEQAKVVTSK